MYTVLFYFALAMIALSVLITFLHDEAQAIRYFIWDLLHGHLPFSTRNKIGG